MIITGRPISKKNAKRIIPHKGRHIIISSKQYLAFEQEALKQLSHYQERYSGPVEIGYLFEMKGKLTTDLDNAIAGINDVLQKAGIIDDDKNVVRIHAEKYQGFADWRTHVTITSIEEAYCFLCKKTFKTNIGLKVHNANKHIL